MLLLALSILAGPSADPASPPLPTAMAAQVAVRNVPVGDPLRRPLLDALRPAVQRDLDGQAVQFMVDRLRVQGDWAFYAGSIQRPDGGEIDFSRTRYQEAIDEGFFDGPATFGLLRRSGSTWRVVTFVIGPTDVAYLGWSEEHGAPEALFR